MLELLEERLDVAAGLLDDARRDPAVLAEQSRRQVLGLDLLLTVALGFVLRLAYRILGFFRQTIRIPQRISLFAG